jgi:hypothetical protein
VAFYLWRWRRSACRRGLDHFRRKWRLAADDPYFARQIAFMAWQRQRALRAWWPLWPALRVLGPRGRSWAAERIGDAVAGMASSRVVRSVPPLNHA